MANALSLLFKIGVDPGDAQKVLDNLKASFKEGLGAGAIQGSKDVEKAFKSSGDALQKFGTQAVQAGRGFQEVFGGNTIGGVANLTRAFGPFGIALAGVAVAAAGVAFAIKGAIDAAHDIGTTSKEDFDALQKKVQSAGESITELQRGMAQGVLDALDKISGASTAFFAKVLEKDGPALIALFNDIAAFITGQLIPLVDKYGDTIADMIARTIALGRVLTKDYSLKDYLTFLPTLEADFAKAYADVKAAIAAIHPAATALVETTKAHKAALKDLTQAELEENEAARALAIQREDAIAQNAEIDRQLRAQAISADEALGKRLAILQNTKFFEDAFFDAQQKRIEAEVQGDKRRTDALEENANKREIAAKKEDEAQIQAATQLDKDQTKFTEARLKQLDQIIEKEKDLDAIVKGRARSAQEVPGGGGAIPGLPDPAETQRQLDAAHNAIKRALGDFTSLLAENNRQIQENIRNAIQLGGAWGGLVGTVKELFSLKNIGDQFVNTLNSMLDVFIQTGHTGPAVLRQMVAGVLRAIAEQAAAWGAYFLLLAIGFAALGDWADAAKFAVAGLGLEVLAAGLGFAASKIAPSQSTAAAAGGGFGGGADQPPGTVTINQGATSALGIQLGILSALQNITTAPPGDILQRGADQNPMAVGQANNEAARRDGSVSREFLQISGLRTA
jgi:hypothetical protein